MTRVKSAVKKIKITWGRKATVVESVQTLHQKSLKLGTTTVLISSKGPEKTKKIKTRTRPQRADVPDPRPPRPRPKGDPGVMAYVSIGKDGDLHIVGSDVRSREIKSGRMVRVGRGVYKFLKVTSKVYDVVIEGEQGERTVDTELEDTILIRIS